MKTFISCAVASTIDHQAKYHIRMKHASVFVYTFGPPIWQRSDGCQAFGHVSENDLLGVDCIWFLLQIFLVDDLALFL